MDTLYPCAFARAHGQQIPSHLGGYQNVVHGCVQQGDLIVYNEGVKRVAGFALSTQFGDNVGDDGYLRPEDGYDTNCALYRKIPVMNQASAHVAANPSVNPDLARCTDAIKEGESTDMRAVQDAAIMLPPVSPPSQPQRGPVSMPTVALGRKALPVATGVLDYFPDAFLAVAACSKAGNDQHNPGKPLFWDRTKSADEDDALLRHFMARGTRDSDGIRHSAKVAWRALAILQKEIEAEVNVSQRVSRTVTQ